ncbi:uncharacterized protein DDB_G0283357 isoform X2 [Condylostylus longicornis]|uniref:uncharacterized protein DDB_G0283357 isoform X2 n=1 Tax=Condylostylus longicornis TaxID=2530218 RepID=UPI00244E0FBD|nr:uncharacterized protein DDB_G0283357 isoform X2 [Condylostylus longicornis]
MANEHDGNIKANYENSSANFNNNETCKSGRTSNRSEAYNSTTGSTERDDKSASSSGFSNSKTMTASNEVSHTNEYKHITSQPQKREENPFSFKHFLNRDTNNSSNLSNISATIVSTNNSINNSNLTGSNITSYQSSNTKNNPYSSVSNLSPSSSASLSSYICNNQVNNNGNGNNFNTTSGENEMFSASNQNKISTSNSNNSGFGSGNSNPYQSSTGARPKVPQSISTSSSIGSGTGGSESSKMKRSPRFSSFDSQASLAECAAGSNNDRSDTATYNNTSGFLRDGAGILDDPGKKTGGLFITNSEYDKQFIPRSYSNYDIDITPSMNNRCSNSSTVGRTSDASNSPFRNRNSSAVRPNRLIGISSQSSPNSSKNQQAYSSSNATNNAGGIRPNSEFAAAALPDFVQDHWMDQWYYNEMNLNSPPNSPNQSPIDFVEDLPSCMATGEKCQTLPDFLSDGPIIHSSGRLADVAAGLPDLDSPEDNSPGLQLSRLRLENERLRRELDESRISLSEQVRRANDLERRLEQCRSNEITSSKNSNQNLEKADENSEQNKKRSLVTENQIAKLKLQIKQLTAEVNLLRKENELIKETGAVGGDIISNRKPSKNQQLSRELMRAAANAESNLRQLLSGVDNLRLMARSLVCDNSVDDAGDGLDFNRQSPTLNAAAAAANISNSASINLVNDEYLSDCDDFDDFSGPAL